MDTIEPKPAPIQPITRDEVALVALQGILSNQRVAPTGSNLQAIVDEAVKIADLFIIKLYEK